MPAELFWKAGKEPGACAGSREQARLGQSPACHGDNLDWGMKPHSALIGQELLGASEAKFRILPFVLMAL